jgi:subtilisin family serine protease
VGRTFYVSNGRRIPVSTLELARVVDLRRVSGQRSVVGWRTVPLDGRFALVVPADAISDRDLRGSRLEDLVKNLADSERSVPAEIVERDVARLSSEIGAPTTPAVLPDGGGLLLPTGRVIVKAKRGGRPGALESRLRELGATVVRELESYPGTFLVEPSRIEDVIDLANHLAESELTEFAAPNFIEEMPSRVVTPANNYFPFQWHLHNVCQNNAKPGADIGASSAWALTRGDGGVVICIIDSGVDSSHESFSLPGKLLAPYDFEDEDHFADPVTSSHGTSCAGIAAAPWEVGRVVGVAPDCTIMPIRRASLSAHLKMAEAFAWAVEHGADVISCSFGYDNRPWVLPDIVREAFDHAVDDGRGGRGCVVVWAAGNGNEDISSDEWASHPKTIAVGASTDSDTRAPYSDFGREVDLCAPSNGGVNGIWTTSNGGYTAHFGGTSAAAPMVAGIAGLLLSVNANLTWSEVKALLQGSCEKIDPDGAQYDALGHSTLYGFGRVRADRALDAISVLEEAARFDHSLRSRLPDVQLFAER